MVTKRSKKIGRSARDGSDDTFTIIIALYIGDTLSAEEKAGVLELFGTSFMDPFVMRIWTRLAPLMAWMSAQPKKRNADHLATGVRPAILDRLFEEHGEAYNESEYIINIYLYLGCPGIVRRRLGGGGTWSSQFSAIG